MRLFDPNPVYLLIRGFFRLLFTVLGSWHIVGNRKYVPKKGPAIIISNHISYLDPPLMGSAVRRPVSYMAKRELFTGNRLLKWVCLRLESYPVTQGGADRQAIRHSLDILKAGRMIGIFPEGHRSEDNQLHEFEQGLAYLALKSRAPVVPCGFAGTWEMLPPHAKRLYRSPVEVHFGPPLELDDLYEMADQRQASLVLTERAYAAVSTLVDDARAARARRLKRA